MATKRERSAIDQAARRLQEIKTLPVLFVGSGISRRYLSLPDWAGLLERFAQLQGRNLAYYHGRTEAGLPGVASEIARDLYEEWWDEERYRSSREEFGELIRHFSDPLKIEVAKYIRTFSPITNAWVPRELEALRSARVHAIVTTNWDELLERCFPDFVTLTGQEEVMFSDTQGVGEIYKIHGSIARPTSLMLTAEDYSAFDSANPYLIAKLFTLFAEHPIVFLGYSLSDTHIQHILASLLHCLPESKVQELTNRLLFVRRRNGDSPTYRVSPMLIEGHSLWIPECIIDDFREFYVAIGSLPRRFPVRILRQLKKEVRDLTLAERPSGRLVVMDIDDDTQFERVDVVIGVGTLARLGAIGYQAFSRRELVLAMLRDDRSIDAQALFKYVIPRVFVQSKFTPIFYPLSLLKDSSAQVSADTLPKHAQDLASGKTKIKPYFSASAVEGRRFAEVLEVNPDLALHAGTAAEFVDDEDISALHGFLLQHFSKSAKAHTDLYKLACVYDRLVFGPSTT